MYWRLWRDSELPSTPGVVKINVSCFDKADQHSKPMSGHDKGRGHERISVGMVIRAQPLVPEQIKLSLCPPRTTEQQPETPVLASTEHPFARLQKPVAVAVAQPRLAPEVVQLSPCGPAPGQRVGPGIPTAGAGTWKHESDTMIDICRGSASSGLRNIDLRRERLARA